MYFALGNRLGKGTIIFLSLKFGVEIIEVFQALCKLALYNSLSSKGLKKLNQQIPEL